MDWVLCRNLMALTLGDDDRCRNCLPGRRRFILERIEHQGQRWKRRRGMTISFARLQEYVDPIVAKAGQLLGLLAERARLGLPTAIV
jgi:hypothetical protein